MQRLHDVPAPENVPPVPGPAPSPSPAPVPPSDGNRPTAPVELPGRPGVPERLDAAPGRA
jgi:hypothetical protein